MNKPTARIEPDDDIGPLDENGQQILSPEEVAAFERRRSDPRFLAEIAEAEADIAAGRIVSHEEVIARSAERRGRWRLQCGL